MIHLIVFIFFYTLSFAQLDPGMVTIQKEWVKAFNQENNAELLSAFYMGQGGIFIENKMIEGAEKTGKVLKELKHVVGKLSQYNSTGVHKLNERNIFEMGHYLSADGSTSLASVIAWNNESGSWKKELEILYVENKVDNFDTDGIDRAREKWVELSNANKPGDLVTQVYTENAVYFNGGKVTQGRPAITTRYDYMSNPKWTISLRSLQQIPVKNNLVLEVGEYRSSGRGYYVLIWIKKGDEWMTNFDFNF